MDVLTYLLDLFKPLLDTPSPPVLLQRATFKLQNVNYLFRFAFLLRLYHNLHICMYGQLDYISTYFSPDTLLTSLTSAPFDSSSHPPDILGRVLLFWIFLSSLISSDKKSPKALSPVSEQRIVNEYVNDPPLVYRGLFIHNKYYRDDILGQIKPLLQLYTTCLKLISIVNVY